MLDNSQMEQPLHNENINDSQELQSIDSGSEPVDSPDVCNKETNASSIISNETISDNINDYDDIMEVDVQEIFNNGTLQTVQTVEAAIENDIRSKVTDGTINVEDIEHKSDDESHCSINVNITDLNKKTLKDIFQHMKTNLSRTELEEIVIQKVCEAINTSSEMARLKKAIEEFKQMETVRKSTLEGLNTQLEQLRNLYAIHMNKIKETEESRGPIPKPTVLSRSVALQVAMPTGLPIGFQVPPEEDTIHKNNARAITTTNIVTASKNTSAITPTSTFRKNEQAQIPAVADVTPSTQIQIPNGSVTDVRFGNNGRLKPTTYNQQEDIVDLTDGDDLGDCIESNQNNVAAPVPRQRSNIQNITKQRINNQHNKKNIHQSVNCGKLNLINLPNLPHSSAVGRIDPPSLTLTQTSNTSGGVTLFWDMPNQPSADTVAYEIHVCHDDSSTVWSKIGRVEAMSLPMECNLTEFIPGKNYFFVVRAIDKNGDTGPFSAARCIFLNDPST